LLLAEFESPTKLANDGRKRRPHNRVLGVWLLGRLGVFLRHNLANSEIL
jgi:hypothetical protein